jgi:hypothetical protein
METNPNIEKEIESTLGAAKSISSLDVPAFYADRTMQRISAVKNEPFLSASVLLKAAAVLILICLNAYTIKYVFETPVQQTPIVANATIDDLVNDYQVADIGTDWLNNNKTIGHE